MGTLIGLALLVLGFYLSHHNEKNIGTPITAIGIILFMLSTY